MTIHDKLVLMKKIDDANNKSIEEFLKNHPDESWRIKTKPAQAGR